MHREERLLKVSTFNVKDIETNKQYLLKLLRTADQVCLQKTSLFNFELRMLDKLHRNFEVFGKAVDDNRLLPRVVVNVYLPSRNTGNVDSYD